MAEVAAQVNAAAGTQGRLPKSVDEVAMGFVQVANETMCRPIRALTQMRGYDVASHVLACFGGAGGQHACAIARSLGMSTIFIHKYALLVPVPMQGWKILLSIVICLHV